MMTEDGTGPHGPVLAARIDAALAQRRFDEAMSLLEDAATAIQAGTVDVRMEALDRWLARLRPYTRDRALLLTLEGWAFANLGQPTLATVALGRAEEVLRGWPPGPERDRALAAVRVGRFVVSERSGDPHTANAALPGPTRPAAVPPMVDERDVRRWLDIDPSGAAGLWLTVIAETPAERDPLGLARGYHNLAMECLRRGEPLPAYRLARAACGVKRGLAAPRSYANSLNTRGMAAAMLGDRDAAEEDFAEAGVIARGAGQWVLATYIENNLAELAWQAGDIDQARSRFARTLAAKERLDDGFGLAWTLRALSALHRVAGEAAEAVRLAERAYALRADCRNATERAQLLVALAAALLSAPGGRRPDAPGRSRALLDEGLALARANDVKDTLALALLHRGLADDDGPAIGQALHLIDRFQLAALAPELSLLPDAHRPPPAASPAPDHPSSEDHPGVRAVARDWRPVPPPVLRVGVLGDFVVAARGTDIPIGRWPSKRAVALLRLLAARRGRWTHRAELTEWLWPEPTGDTRALLNGAVNTVRRGLERATGQDGLLERAGERYRLHAAVSDAADFEALVLRAEQAARTGRPALAEAWYERALGCWRGPEALPEDKYADWALPERQRLHERVQLCRERLAASALGRGDADQAAGYASAALASDPYRESALRLYLRALISRGDRTSAGRALAEFTARVRATLGMDPSPDLAELVTQASGRSGPNAEATGLGSGRSGPNAEATALALGRSGPNAEVTSLSPGRSGPPQG